MLRARYENQFSSRLAQMRFTSFACRLCVVVLVILLFGVARIVYIDFSGILAPASPVESLSSHKQTTATDFICRFFCASREVWKSIFVPLSTNALHFVRMSFVCRGAGNSVVWGCENSVYRFQRYSRSGFAGRIPQLPQANDGDRFYLSLFLCLARGMEINFRPA